MASKIDWAGVKFIAVFHHDGRFFRVPGLFGFARREPNGDRTLLFIGHTDHIAIDAGPGSCVWADALELGMNELHLCLHAQERLDRLQLADRIVKRVGPILNVIETKATRPLAQPLRKTV